MGQAYEWLTDTEKSTITALLFRYNTKKIYAEFKEGAEITYENLDRLTSISYGREYMQVQDEFVNVFCEDLECFLMNQKTELSTFRVECNSNDADFEREPLLLVIDRIFECLERVLKRKNPELLVRFTILHVGNCSQAMDALRNLNFSSLENIQLKFLCGNQEIDDLLQLVPLNKGKRMNLFLVMHSVTSQNLASMKQLVSHPETFYELVIFYTEMIEVDLNQIFEIPFEHKDHRLHKIMKFVLENPKTTQNDLKVVPEDFANKSSEIFENTLIMGNILDYLQCFDIQCLRKVSSGVRNLIDRLHPDPHIEKYELALWTETMEHFDARIVLDNGAYKNISYEKFKTLKYEDFMNNEDYEFTPEDLDPTIIEDFFVNLRYQQKPIKELRLLSASDIYICADQFFAMLQKMLLSRKSLLKVEKLYMESVNQNQVLQVMPYIDSKSVRAIKLSSPTTCAMSFDQISKLDQWEHADQLVIKRLIITSSLPEIKISSFSKIDILVKTITSEDVVHLKTELFKSPKFQKFKISFRCSTIDETLHSLIGEPYRAISNVKKIWYFRMPNPDFYLHIVLEIHNHQDEDGAPKTKVILFSKVLKEDTPFF